MKIYWDTSALIYFHTSGRIQEISGVTRTHSLAEIFSTLTGRGVSVIKPNGGIEIEKLSMALAAAVVTKIHSRMEFVDLTADEALAAIQKAKSKNAQGGRVHDLLHAAAAEKAKADEIWTTDRNDFEGLGATPVKQL